MKFKNITHRQKKEMAADLATQLHDDPDNYVNDANVEVAWAMKAAESASIHMNLLLSVDTRTLRLNKHQEDVCERFRKYFPDMDVAKVGEMELKGDNRERWREFCEEFKEVVADYNMGTMLRIDAKGIYDDANTVIVPKIIYLAIEGTRNSEGVNEKWKDHFRELHNFAKANDENVL